MREICPPALIYLIFSVTQVVIDTIKGMYNVAFLKICVALIFTVLLNYLCTLGLGIISWIIVFIPFILMTLIVSMLLLMFGLDPTTGKLQIYDPNQRQLPRRIGPREQARIDYNNEMARLGYLKPQLLPPVDTSVTGVYIDTAKNGKNVINAQTTQQAIGDINIDGRIKAVVAIIYKHSKDSQLSSFTFTKLNECKNLAGAQCNEIWMKETVPILRSRLGKMKYNAIMRELLTTLNNAGVTTNLGDFIIGKQPVESSAEKALSDIKSIRSGL